MSDPCPLCQSGKHMRKTKTLYGVTVCKRCYYGFTNRRQLAYVIDWLVWLPISLFLGGAVALMLETAGMDEAMQGVVGFLIGYLILPLVFFCKDGFKGRSIGKLATGVHVVNKDTHETIGFMPSLMRNLPLLIPVVPIIIALTLAKGYRWGDGWAKSKVIWTKYAEHPVFTGLLACEHCQYNLTGNTSGACPECGTPISAANEQWLALESSMVNDLQQQVTAVETLDAD